LLQSINDLLLYRLICSHCGWYSIVKNFQFLQTCWGI